MSARALLARATAAGLALRLDDAGSVRVTGRATPDLLAELRSQKDAIAELLALPPPLVAILAAFPGATVELRPPTPIPPPIAYGDWPVWSAPLRPRRGKARKRAEVGWQGPGPDPLACVHCHEFCDPRDLSNGQRPGGMWEHLECWLKAEGR